MEAKPGTAESATDYSVLYEGAPIGRAPVRWRVGGRIPINVYDGDRPVCQCQTAVDARTIVNAVNLAQFNAWLRGQDDAVKDAQARTPSEHLGEAEPKPEADKPPMVEPEKERQG